MDQFTLFDQPKRCSKCGETKPLSEFHRNKGTKDGKAFHCKVCARARAKQWRAENLERASESARQWYLKNSEQAREKSRLWRAENRERHRAYSRRWNTENPERASARGRRWREENPERYRENYRQWRAENLEQAREESLRWQLENPERSRAISRNYRARKNGALGDGATLSELAAKHGLLCYLCNSAPATVVEHVIPLSRGGSNQPENLRPACASCNFSKGAKTYEEYLAVLTSNSRNGNGRGQRGRG